MQIDDGQDNGGGVNLPDQADLMRRLIRECSADLAQGRLPAPRLDGLSPVNATAIAELAGVAGAIKRKNRSMEHGIEALRDGFALFGPDLRLIYCNYAFRASFGGRIAVTRGAHVDQLMDALERYQLVEVEGASVADWRAGFLNKNGKAHVLHLFNDRICRVFSKFLPDDHLICFANEITGDIQRQRDLETARLRAEEAGEARATFLAHISHELRTPMNGVIGMAELLCDSGLTGENQRYAETIRNLSEALLGIINDVLEHARGRHSKPRLNEVDFDLEAMAVEVLTLLQPLAFEKGLDLNLLFDPLTPSRWRGDAGRLRQVILNLVGNAVKYTMRGFVRLQIVAGPNGLNILVQDSGPGIPDHRIDSIFEEFSQLAEPGVTGIAGSGLGLTIAAQVAEAIGGHIWVSSAPGEGSTFGICLPFASPSALQDSANPCGPGDVVMVCDNIGTMRQLRRMFAVFGRNLAIVPDVMRLRSLLYSGYRSDVVILKHLHEGDDQQEIIPTVRELMPDATLRVLLPATRHHVFATGFDAVFTSPLTRLALAEMAVPGRGPADQNRPEDGAPVTILLADDNRTNRLVVEKMLTDCNIDLIEAQNGQEAVELWCAHRPQLILMDISMPVMDGRAASQAIRQIEADMNLPPCRIVALTANAAPEDHDKILASGLNEVMTKPVRRASLLAMIRRNTAPGLAAGALLQGRATGS